MLNLTSDILPKLLTTVFYLWFAWQCGVFAKDKKNKAQKYFVLLAVVFVACAITGYFIPALIELFSSNSALLAYSHFIVHWILAIAALGLCISGAGVEIKKVLGSHNGRIN